MTALKQFVSQDIKKPFKDTHLNAKVYSILSSTLWNSTIVITLMFTLKKWMSILYVKMLLLKKNWPVVVFKVVTGPDVNLVRFDVKSNTLLSSNNSPSEKLCWVDVVVVLLTLSRIFSLDLYRFTNWGLLFLLLVL